MGIAEELDKYLMLEQQGIIISVRRLPPKPWPPALEMLALNAQGKNISEIAEATGFSKITVERNLRTGGIDRRVGPQCYLHLNKVFTVEAAKATGLLPCKPECICRWSQVTKSSR